jgi:glucosyl-dolichyl phosphate glucuronosyltransferase
VVEGAPHRAESISVLIPTRGWSKSLEETLASIARTVRPDIPVDVIVIDNSSSGPINSQSGAGYPTRYIRSEPPGKNRALNRGVKETRGQLVVFLDDDVTVSLDFFIELIAGAARWPSAAGYAGRAVAVWPPGNRIPSALAEYASFAFASNLHLLDEGELPATVSPLELNMAFWRDELPSDTPFDPETGPQPGRYRMGGGESLFLPLRQRGERLVHLPKVVVEHRIRSEQLTEPWLRRRSFSYGRSLGFFGNTHNAIHGDAPLPVLLAQWAVRITRVLVMSMRRKEVPRLWGVVDRRLIEGILYERLFIRKRTFSAATPSRDRRDEIDAQ